MRNKLLEAIKPLQLNTNDKNKLVNTIIDIGNSGGGAVSQYAPRYFKIDWDKADIEWRQLLAYIDSDNEISLYRILRFAASVKQKLGERDIAIAAFAPNDYNGIIAFSFIPLYAPNGLGIDINWIKTMEDYIIFANCILKNITGIESNLSMEGITEITEEEFYKID